MTKAITRPPKAETSKYIFTLPLLTTVKIGSKIWDSNGVVVVEAVNLSTAIKVLTAKIGGRHFADNIYPYQDFPYWDLFPKGVFIEVNAAKETTRRQTSDLYYIPSKTYIADRPTVLF